MRPLRPPRQKTFTTENAEVTETRRLVQDQDWANNRLRSIHNPASSAMPSKTNVAGSGVGSMLPEATALLKPCLLPNDKFIALLSGRPRRP